MNDEHLNLEFVDEALRLVDEAESRGIQLRILGSVAYRLQCPNNVHLFEDMARALTDVDFAAEKKQNRAIRDFLMAAGYQPDEGVYVASEGARHIYLHPETGLNVDVFADEPRVPAALCELPNVVLLPHIGSATHETRGAMEDLLLDNLDSFLREGRLLTPV
mgnify:CR=1 FL=1